MSYVLNIKKLLADDLKGLITHVTGHQEGSSEFKKCEDTSWSLIVDHYYPSVYDLKVKSTLNDFVDKFKVHGFPQKAKNLKMLIEAYSELDYFKKFCGPGIQWGLVDFLIKLSFKPTNSLEDDPPLNLEKGNKNKDEAFDWGAYLKEGYEKFQLPSEDEESWTEEEEEEVQNNTAVPILETFKPAHVPSPPRPTPSELRLEALQRADSAAKWLEVNTQGLWWKNPVFREIPESRRNEANYCLIWEKVMKRNGVPINETRIIGEHKVVMELLYVLSTPSSCYFIREISKDCFKAVPDISISSISPNLFSIIVEENICLYLPYLKKIQGFISEMEQNFSSSIPCTYRAFGYSLKKILSIYRRKLENIERKVEAQEDITTLRYLITEITPWLHNIEYLYRVLESAISYDYKEKDCRSNALRLLSTLYGELKGAHKWRRGDIAWQKNMILCLFIDALEPVLNMLCCHMASKYHKNFGSEFFLCGSGTLLVDTYPNDTEEFWKPFLQLASAAIISCNFLTVLGKEPSFFTNKCPTDVMYIEIVKKLSNMLELPEIKTPNDEDIVSAYSRKEELFSPEVRQMLFHSENLIDKVFREVIAPRPKLTKSTITNSLMENLKNIDLSTSAVHIYLKEAILNVIEDYMEPKGFAADILLGQFKLLEHLNALYTVVQLTSVLSTVLITESFKVSKRFGSVRINKCFERFTYCLLGVLSQDYVNNFKFHIDSCLFEKKNTSLLEKSDFIHLYYQASQEIKVIISDEVIHSYTKIFRYLLKIRIALDTIKRLTMDFIEETEENILRFRQLCSLRLWLIHTMSTLNNYFSTYTDTEFQNEIKKLCLKERNLSAIYVAHKRFLKNWKYHSFISENHPCLENVEEFISICNELNFYWKLERKHLLADYQLEQIEQKYLDCIRKFVLNIQLFEDRLVDRNDTFAFFYDEIMNNVPVPLLTSTPETSLSSE
ncbi:gamma-tubulin complex component 5 [Halyomorpha halys]|uniref:gamma-tubulin complex component 5 n=1 Tax=Halyomorpha halys TaxID=286706 RepID=UPI0006D51929|nr:gamma-tubulin complex component 5 [Halyomorpha halys]XP_014286124.1 gamma-tubulin complex component 5 [Halyomorpha halys]